MKEYLDIALVQMTSVDSLATNLHKIESIFNGIKGGTVDLICFPENCLFLRVREGDAVEKFELSHSCFLWLGEWAKKLKTTLHLGSVPLQINGKLFNSSVWIDPDGRVRAGYQKIHLFDIELSGQKPIKESAVFERGHRGQVQTFMGWKFGESICYDIRFGDLYSLYAHQKVDLLMVPAAFLVETGKAHWEILLRARAIESQCYLVASAQVGTHISTKGSAERQTFGHSMIIDPWGRVEVDLGEKENVLIHRISYEAINNVRRQIPMSSHRQEIKG